MGIFTEKEPNATENYVDTSITNVSGSLSNEINTQTISDLADVNSPSPLDYQVLTWSGSNWIPTDQVSFTGGSMGEWEYKGISFDSDPGNKKFKVDNSDQTLITEIYMSNINRANIDLGNFLDNFENGDKLYLQKTNTSAQAYLYEITSVSDNTTYHTFSVTYEDDTGIVFKDKDKITFVKLGKKITVITDHGLLTGLGDDDHLQYVPTNGTRGFTNTVSGVDPTLDYHLATKKYIDDVGDSVITAYIDTYDNSGGQTFTTTNTILNLDTVRINSGHFNLASDEITVVSGVGASMCILRTSVGAPGRCTVQAWLELNTGGGYLEVDGSRGNMYCRNQSSGENTCTVPVMLDLSVGDKLRIRMVRITGSSTITTTVDAAGLSISTLKGGTKGEDGANGIDGVDGAPGPPGGGSTINVYDAGSTISGSPFQTLNFVGFEDVSPSVTSGTVDITHADPTFGTYYGWATDNTQSSTTSTSYQQKLRYTSPSMPAGYFRIGWQFEWRRNSTGNDFKARTQIDDTTTIMQMNIESKDPNSWHPVAGFYIVQFTSGSHYIDIDYSGETTGNTSYIRRARIEMWRVA